MIYIVGLGPVGIDSMSVAALKHVESAERLFLRTGVHPAAAELAARGVKFQTFDYLYETAASFDEVYNSIADFVLSEGSNGDLVYAVPGHPLCAERNVEIIINRAKSDGVDYKLIGSQSFVDACLEALSVPLGKGLKLVDALDIATVPPAHECPNLIYQVYDRFVASDLKLSLMETYPDEFEVYILTGAGGPDVIVDKIPLYELDRRDVNHLSSVYVPELTVPQE